MIPHPSKAHKGGEDAFFANEKILMVADGVGGWADVIVIFYYSTVSIQDFTRRNFAEIQAHFLPMIK